MEGVSNRNRQIEIGFHFVILNIVKNLENTS